MIKRIFYFLLIASFNFLNISLAYEIETHAIMSRHAAEASNLTTPYLLPSIGLIYPIDSESQKFSNSKNEKETILDIIQDGARFEDDGVRPFNHFYDPANDRALTFAGVPMGYRSPDWALEDIVDLIGVDISEQNFSYYHAREYFYAALTNSDKSIRDTNFGLLFQTIGQIIHHIQDMAQPQHVRNDLHCDPEQTSTKCGIVLANPSLYEKFTDKIVGGRIVGNLPYDGYTPVQLPLARHYWHTEDNKGIADYTNRGFVSQGTNFRFQGPFVFPDQAYALPAFESATETKVDIQAMIPETNLSGTLTFYGLNIEDNYLGGAPELNGLATTLSVFDKYLKKYEPTSGVRGMFTLNEFNFWSGYQFLIPRAVGYSAGLIDHFFRGRMEISLPEERIYGIVDNAALPDSSKGFKKIRLNLKNVTPAIDPPGAEGPYAQEMTAGELRAVVKYRRNPCFAMNYSGEVKLDVGQTPASVIEGKPLAELSTWNGCTQAQVYEQTEEVISVSTPLPVTPSAPVPTDTAATYTFDFVSDEIPVDAVDVYLQVVYRGVLGPADNPAYQEPDAVVVATKRISAPTPIVWTNTTDYVLDASDYPNTAKAYRTPAAAIDGPVPPEYEPGPVSIEVKTGPVTAPIPLVNASNLPLGAFFRVSVLTDPDALAVNLFVDGASLPDAAKLGIGDYTGYDPDRDQTIVRPMIHTRGIYVAPGGALNYPDIITYYGSCQFARGYPATGSGVDVTSQEDEISVSDSCRGLPALTPTPQPVNVITFE